MRKYKNKNVGLISLKAKIRGFEMISKAILKESKKTSGRQRHNLHLTKYQLGRKCREHLAAYALIRNIPFNKVEQSCREGNYLNASNVLSLIIEHGRFIVTILETGGVQGRPWKLEDVQMRLLVGRRS